MKFVVDASVALKWLVAEADSEVALALRADNAIIAPDLLLIECRNALLSKVRRRELKRAQAQDAERELGAIGIEIVASSALLPEAFAIALDLAEPIYDCIYLATAIAADCKLVTADERFAAKASKSSAGQDRIELLGATSA